MFDQSAGEFGTDNTRAHRIDANITCGEFERECLKFGLILFVKIFNNESKPVNI